MEREGFEKLAIAEFIRIKFQEGPVKESGINGCQTEDVIDVLLERLAKFQDGPLGCKENAQAIMHLSLARVWLITRTQNRQRQGVEGTMDPHKTIGLVPK